VQAAQMTKFGWTHPHVADRLHAAGADAEPLGAGRDKTGRFAPSVHACTVGEATAVTVVNAAWQGRPALTLVNDSAL
jgi:hypothetical protein